MAGIGEKWSLSGAWLNVGSWFRKRTFDLIAAAQNDHSVGNVSYGVCKRKS
jgi:hypothetical protein